MYIHFEDDFINEILESIKLADIMRLYNVRVKTGSGDNDYYVSWCCNKNDFDNGRINKENPKHLYQCLACRKGGNAITFLRERAGMTFHEAVSWLADYAGFELPITTLTSRQAAENRRSFALREAVSFYQNHTHDYFIKRGISPDVLKKLGAGYAPGGRKLRTHLENKGFTKDELVTYGLVNKENGNDAFFYRAVLPIYHNGQVIDIYGRAVDDKKSLISHCYLRGKDTLDGIDNVDPNKLVYIFEGHIDKGVAESFRITNGVTPGGAFKFNNFHARLLQKRGVKRAAILYDGDDAGREGAYQTGELLQLFGIESYVVEFPDGEDIASLLIKNGLDEIKTYTRNSKPYAKYKAYYLLKQLPFQFVEAFYNEFKKESSPI